MWGPHSQTRAAEARVAAGPGAARGPCPSPPLGPRRFAPASQKQTRPEDDLRPDSNTKEPFKKLRSLWRGLELVSQRLYQNHQVRFCFLSPKLWAFTAGSSKRAQSLLRMSAHPWVREWGTRGRTLCDAQFPRCVCTRAPPTCPRAPSSRGNQEEGLVPTLPPQGQAASPPQPLQSVPALGVSGRPGRQQGRGGLRM